MKAIKRKGFLFFVYVCRDQKHCRRETIQHKVDENIEFKQSNPRQQYTLLLEKNVFIKSYFKVDMINLITFYGKLAYDCVVGKLKILLKCIFCFYCVDKWEIKC